MKDAPDVEPPDDEAALDPDAAEPPDDEAAIPQAMAALLEMTVDLEPPVAVTVEGASSAYALGGRTFAVASGRAFEADLGPEVAAAAMRTPDVRTSSRGPGWIRLDPPLIDDHAADRVIAWFELARRIAAGRRSGSGDRPARA
jgi:hypothetical protein